tara:strand:+ start:413 stop:715 length:303 start_codon:yes stop_codon:yes gene_type:complete
MEFKVLGYKLQLEVVIACMILGCLICTLTICSCSKVTAKEGFAILQNGGLMNLLQNGTFKPECCPTTYSNSSGCLCMDDKLKCFLRTRGGNSKSSKDHVF